MSDMTATERLRALLDEREIGWFENDFGLNWWYHDNPHTAMETIDGTLIVTGLAPEQVVAATLGPGTCEIVDDDAFEYEDGYTRSVCRSCRKWFTHGSMPVHYCPNCGRKAVETDG